MTVERLGAALAGRYRVERVYEAASMAGGSEVLRLAGTGGRTTVALPGRNNDNLEDPAFSPDGRRIALRLLGATGSASDVWLLDRQQGTLDRFTVGDGLVPTWSRDGKRIAYATAAGIFVKQADQTGAAELILRGSGLHPGSWLPDGLSLVFQQSGRPNTRQDIGIIRLGDSLPRWLVATEFRERQPQVSPDGKLLAYASDRTGQFEVATRKTVVEGGDQTGGGGTRLVWILDWTELVRGMSTR